MMVTVTERGEGREMGVSFIVVTRSRLLLVCVCVCVVIVLVYVCVCQRGPPRRVSSDMSTCARLETIRFDKNGHRERTKHKPVTIFQSKKKNCR